MPTLDNLATRFAHCVSLFRDPTAKAEQKKEFRALLGLLQDTAVTLRLAQGGSGIEANDVPCEGEGVAVLVERLDLHGIGEIALPANPPPAQLFELLQALADQPGAHDVTSRLAAAGADRIRIAPVVSPPRQRPRADRWPPPRTSVRASPSSPTRTRRWTGSPVRSAPRGSCAASPCGTSSPSRSRACRWSRTTLRPPRRRTRSRA